MRENRIDIYEISGKIMQPQGCKVVKKNNRCTGRQSNKHEQTHLTRKTAWKTPKDRSVMN